MRTHGRTEVNPKVMLGKLVIRGTRMTVEFLLRKLAEGASEAETLGAFPQLAPEDIKAALAFADAVAERSSERERNLA